MLMEYKIRKRKLSDCKDIANIATIAWNETYKGIVLRVFLTSGTLPVTFGILWLATP